jgi:UDP-N-acetylmuramoylalanine--D-glutamate ligase
MMFAGVHFLVVGLGASGRAAAEVLAGEGASVRVSEAASDVADRQSLEQLGVEVFSGGHEPIHLDGIDRVVVSPGVFDDAPVVAWARERGLPVWSELELGAQLCDAPYIAVTGTNGKTTTTEMIAATMRADGRDAVACGNIGHPFTLAAREQHDALAVEASSFQLNAIETFHPRVSVLLNVAPDHLDWHGGFERYAAAKGRITENQGAGDAHVANADDPLALAVSARATCRIVTFTHEEPGEDQVGYRDGLLVSRLDGVVRELGRPRSQGAGFRADAAATAAAGLLFGLPPEAVVAGIASTEPLPHRGTTVAEIGSGAQRIVFVDDSKATNPHATLAGLEGRTEVVLIAGGLAKGVDLSPLLAATHRLKGVVAIGEAAPELERLFTGEVPVRTAGSMDEAVAFALELAEGGGTVLLAPACASQDMFRDYRERGDRFAEAAAQMVGVARG